MTDIAPGPDFPMDGGLPAKPLHQSKTILYLMAAGIVQLVQTVAAAYGHEWALPALGQLQLFLLGMAGVSRAVATRPLK